MNWVLVIVGASVGAPPALSHRPDRASRTRHPVPLGRIRRQPGRMRHPSAYSPAQPPREPASSHTQLLVGTGLCGALTTYSTFCYETLRLAQTGARFYAAANVIAGLGAVFTGTALAQAIWA